jgi:hypothetical protein
MRRFLILGGLALILALVAVAATFPLATAIGLAGLPVEGRASGTVWNGRVDGAVIEGAALGTLTIRTEALPLLTGVQTARLSLDGPGVTAAGLVTKRGEMIEARDLTGTVDLGAIGLPSLTGLPFSGDASVVDGAAVLTPKGCAEAALPVTATLRPAAGMPLFADGLTLEGTGRCEDGVLVLPLAGQGQGGSASALLRLTLGVPLRYTAELSLRPVDPRAAAALRAYGFREGPGGYSFARRGTF